MLGLTAAFAQDAQDHSVPAFPGAEGHGRYVTGGRGGEVRHVTNLENTGEGSFRTAVSGDQPKIVVFDVAGVIPLLADVTIGANTTIAGQTAPYPGITLRYRTLRVKDNVIMRYIRMRGSISMPEDKCTLTMDNCENVIMDHCSISWGRWDNVHIKDANNIT